MSSLDAIAKQMDRVARRLPELVTRTMRDALKNVAQTAATKYMIETGINFDINRPNVKSRGAAVDPERLTWRTGALANSLVRDLGEANEDAQAIQRVERSGESFIGTLGSKLPYAAIHEKGGTIPEHRLTITDQMRKFFWATFYESTKSGTGDESLWKAMALTQNALLIPEIPMKARPYLAPAITDKQVVDSNRRMFGLRVRALLVEELRA